MSLFDLDNPYTDKNSIHSYLEVYEDLFSAKKNTAVNILEIGVHEGGSIKMWSDYFVNGTVYGLDTCDIQRIQISSIITQNNVKLIMNNNAYNKEFVNKYLSHLQFDFLIDDGPHTLDSMSFFIDNYTPLLKDDGILIIEDIQDFTWIEQLKNRVPQNLQEYIKVYDLRLNKNRYDDILFTINKSRQT